MEQERSLQLLLRQLKDIQAQADRILSGDKSGETIESFARYSVDLKNYIAKNIKDENIHSYLKEIPHVEYRRITVKMWQYLFLPSWFITLHKDYITKNRIIPEINTIKGKYAYLELRIKELTV